MHRLLLKKNEKNASAVTIAVLLTQRCASVGVEWGRNAGPGNSLHGQVYQECVLPGPCYHLLYSRVLAGDGHGGVKLHQCFLIR